MGDKKQLLSNEKITIEIDEATGFDNYLYAI